MTPWGVTPSRCRRRLGWEGRHEDQLHHRRQAALRKQVEGFSERRIASIMATALTRTAVEVRAAVQEEAAARLRQAYTLQ